MIEEIDSYLVDGEIVKLQPDHGKQMQGFQKLLPPTIKIESTKVAGQQRCCKCSSRCGKAMISYLKNPEKFQKRQAT